MICDVSEELAIRYMLALDAVAAARQELCHAVTQMQIECASTKLSRLEAHRLSELRDLALHCERHGCATPEIEKLLAQRHWLRWSILRGEFGTDGSLSRELQ